MSDYYYRRLPDHDPAFLWWCEFVDKARNILGPGEHPIQVVTRMDGARFLVVGDPTNFYGETVLNA